MFWHLAGETACPTSPHLTSTHEVQTPHTFSRQNVQTPDVGYQADVCVGRPVKPPSGHGRKSGHLGLLVFNPLLWAAGPLRQAGSLPCAIPVARLTRLMTGSA